MNEQGWGLAASLGLAAWNHQTPSPGNTSTKEGNNAIALRLSQVIGLPSHNATAKQWGRFTAPWAKPLAVTVTWNTIGFPITGSASMWGGVGPGKLGKGPTWWGPTAVKLGWAWSGPITRTGKSHPSTWEESTPLNKQEQSTIWQ